MSATKRLQNLCIAAFPAREMPTRYLPWEPLRAPNSLQCHLLSSVPQSRICDANPNVNSDTDNAIALLPAKIHPDVMTVLFVGNQECLDVWLRMAAQFYILCQNPLDYFGILD